MNRLTIVSGAVAAGVLLTVYGVVTLSPPQAASEPALPIENEKTTTVLHLHPGERLAAGIELQPLKKHLVRTTRTLPGRIAYDATKHVAVVAAETGVVVSATVQPGNPVHLGQTLAVMRCPAIGAARSKLLQHLSELKIAEQECQWQTEIADGAETLLYLIDQQTPIEQIEKRLATIRIGANREILLNAYSRLLLATRLAKSAADAGGAEVLSRRVIDERRAEVEQATAALEAKAEEVRFEAKQASDSARSAFEAAQRRVDVARQELTTLLGLPADSTNDEELLPEGDDLTSLEVRSPIDGTVERRTCSAAERVTQGDELFVIADTSRLWVEADIRGADWAALRVREGDLVRVATPATGDHVWDAQVVYIGRESDLGSGATPLVAALENREGKLRPGLFARIEAPTSEEVEALVAPSAAVVNLNGAPTVFVPDGEGFKAVTVETGRRFGDLVELLSPLTEGDRVVTSGAFFLKSELLLAGEE